MYADGAEGVRLSELKKALADAGGAGGAFKAFLVLRFFALGGGRSYKQSAAERLEHTSSQSMKLPWLAVQLRFDPAPLPVAWVGAQGRELQQEAWGYKQGWHLSTIL